jgi:hypothetical protein
MKIQAKVSVRQTKGKSQEKFWGKYIFSIKKFLSNTDMSFNVL